MASPRAYSEQLLAKDDLNACFQKVAAARPQLLRELDFDLENAREVLAWFAPVYCDCKPQMEDMEKAIATLAAWRASAGKLQEDWLYNAQEAAAWSKDTMVREVAATWDWHWPQRSRAAICSSLVGCHSDSLRSILPRCLPWSICGFERLAASPGTN